MFFSLDKLNRWSTMLLSVVVLASIMYKPISLFKSRKHLYVEIDTFAMAMLLIIALPASQMKEYLWDLWEIIFLFSDSIFCLILGVFLLLLYWHMHISIILPNLWSGALTVLVEIDTLHMPIGGMKSEHHRLIWN